MMHLAAKLNLRDTGDRLLFMLQSRFPGLPNYWAPAV